MNEKVKRIGNWINNHKWGLLTGGAAAGIVILTYKLGVKHGITMNIEEAVKRQATENTKLGVVPRIADITANLVSDVDGNTASYEVWSEDMEGVAIVTGLTDLAAGDHLKNAIDIMKKNIPNLDYKNGNIIVEFMAKE